jgi:hypothetical protein
MGKREEDNSRRGKGVAKGFVVFVFTDFVVDALFFAGFDDSKKLVYENLYILRRKRSRLRARRRMKCYFVYRTNYFRLFSWLSYS